MEGLALTGAWVDRERGLVSTIVLEMGGSSNLCVNLQPGEPVVLMGPTGTPTEIVAGETVVLAGGGLGNAVLFSIGQALRERRLRACCTSPATRSASIATRSRRSRPPPTSSSGAATRRPDSSPSRPQDRAYVGNIVEAMRAYAAGELGAPPIAMSATDRVIAIGSDRMMAAVARARARRSWRRISKPGIAAIGSINSPMQCMMKEVCGQCLQPHVDPVSGARSYVFSCFNQDQPLDRVDFDALGARLRQNSVQEKLTATSGSRTSPDAAPARTRPAATWRRRHPPRRPARCRGFASRSRRLVRRRCRFIRVISSATTPTAITISEMCTALRLAA